MRTIETYIATLTDSLADTELKNDLAWLDSWEEGAFFSMMDAYNLTPQESLSNLNNCAFFHSYTMLQLAEESFEFDDPYFDSPQELAQEMACSGYVETEYGVIYL